MKKIIVVCAAFVCAAFAALPASAQQISVVLEAEEGLKIDFQVATGVSESDPERIYRSFSDAQLIERRFENRYYVDNLPVAIEAADIKQVCAIVAFPAPAEDEQRKFVCSEWDKIEYSDEYPGVIFLALDE